MLAFESAELHVKGYKLFLKEGNIIRAVSDMDKIWLVRRLFAMGWIEHQNRDFFLNHSIEARFFPKISKGEWDRTWIQMKKEREEQNLFEILLASDWVWSPLTEDFEGERLSLMDQEKLESLVKYWENKSVYSVACIESALIPSWLKPLLDEPIFLDDVLLNSPLEGIGTIMNLLVLEREGAITILKDLDNTDLFFSEESDQMTVEDIEGHEAFVDIGLLYQQVYEHIKQQGYEPKKWFIKMFKGQQEELFLLENTSFEEPPSNWIAKLIEQQPDERALQLQLSRFFARLLKSRLLVSERKHLNDAHQNWKHQWKL